MIKDIDAFDNFADHFLSLNKIGINGKNLEDIIDFAIGNISAKERAECIQFLTDALLEPHTDEDLLKLWSGRQRVGPRDVTYARPFTQLVLGRLKDPSITGFIDD